MRRLWITRRKAEAACLTKMKVYLEDPQGDTRINGFPCRKLGELKNGEKSAFPIGEGAARVFVVADSLSRNLYNEFADIPAGEEDVFLSGRNVWKPFSGNPFRFDDAFSEETLENRRQVSRRGSRTMILAILAGILAGVAAGAAVGRFAVPELFVTADRTFRAEELQITLTEEFQETEVPGYTACFTDGETGVFVLREDLEQMRYYGKVPLEVYGAMILANNGFGQEVRLEESEGLTTFAAKPVPEWYYYCGLFQSGDAYWMVQITAPAEDGEERVSQFRTWLKTVCFVP